MFKRFFASFTKPESTPVKQTVWNNRQFNELTGEEQRFAGRLLRPFGDTWEEVKMRTRCSSVLACSYKYPEMSVTIQLNQNLCMNHAYAAKVLLNEEDLFDVEFYDENKCVIDRIHNAYNTEVYFDFIKHTGILSL